MSSAGVSVDVDSVRSHLEGYGVRDAADCGAEYVRAVPRALDLFDRANVRATFFLIGRDAARHPDIVREIARRGHELASHSMTHRLPFSDLDGPGLDSELLGSRELLGTLSGTPVVGFRAPSWDSSDRVLEAAVRAGFGYDASAFPSILLPVLRLAVARRSEAPPPGRPPWSGVFDRAEPHVRRVGDRQIVEIPILTTPGLRLPYYHTLRFMVPEKAWQGMTRAARSRRTLTYVFHAVDFLDAAADRLDPRIGRHPGMSMTLDRKLELAERSLGLLLRGRRVEPLRDIAAGVARLAGHDSVRAARPPIA